MPGPALKEAPLPAGLWRCLCCLTGSALCGGPASARGGGQWGADVWGCTLRSWLQRLGSLRVSAPLDDFPGSVLSRVFLVHTLLTAVGGSCEPAFLPSSVFILVKEILNTSSLSPSSLLLSLLLSLPLSLSPFLLLSFHFQNVNIFLAFIFLAGSSQTRVY